MPTVFKIKNKTTDRAEILIYDQIGQGWFSGISAQDFSKELSSLPSSIKTIDVRINSPGGSVFEGYTIYNRLKQHKAEINVYIDGIAASIASVIALAGDKVYASEISQFMIHKPLVGVYGNATTLQTMIERLDTIEDQIIKIYKEKSGLDEAELATMLAAETFFTAEQALEHGFVDEIIPVASDASASIAACANNYIENCEWMKKATPIKLNPMKNKIDEIFKNDEGFLARI